MTVEPEAPRRGRVDTGGTGGLGLDVRALRERRVRRSGMVGDEYRRFSKQVGNRRLGVVEKMQCQIEQALMMVMVNDKLAGAPLKVL